MPFMQVGTYPTRNFATLEPSGVQLPFAGGYLPAVKQKGFLFAAPGRHQTLYII